MTSSDDEDFGGEPGLVMEDLAEAIKTLLMDDKVGSSGIVASRITESLLALQV